MDELNPQAVSPAPDTAPEATPAETPSAEPKAPPTRHELLTQAFQKPPNERGRHATRQPRDQGRFAGPPQPTPPPAAAAPAPPLPVPHPEMPKSLRQELKDHWAKTPREIAEAVIQREADSQRGVEQLRSRAVQADEILNEFKPYEWMLRNENITPKAAVSELLKVAALLRTGTPAQKAQSVAHFMRHFSIPLEHVHQMLGGPSGPQPVTDPGYNQMSQEIQQLKQSLTQQQQERVEQEQQRALAAIQAFANDPAHLHFDSVQDTMLALLQNPTVLGDVAAMNEQQKLKAAYDAAVKLAGLAPPPPHQAQQQQAQQVSQARAAAVQVTGAPSPAPAQAVNPHDRRALLEHAFSRRA